jgi:hypothetical protein
MVLLPRPSKTKVQLVLGITLALVAAWVTAILYIKTHFYYTGKGSRDTYFETLVYSLALTLALTLLASLRSAHVLWRVLFIATALAMVAFMWALFDIAGADGISNVGFTWGQPLIHYLDVFPFFCAIALIGIFLKK